MPQAELPIFDKEITQINTRLGYVEKEGTTYYFLGQLPIFSHPSEDRRAFRVMMAQLYVNGSATQAELSNAFKLGKNSLKRYVKKYRTEGIEGFYAPRKARSSPVLTPEVLVRIQALLDEGSSISAAAEAVAVSRDVVSKAIGDGRLRRPKKKR